VAALADYHAQTEVPVVRMLLTDDAPQFWGVTEDHGLCWVHWGRNLKEPGHRGSAPRPGSPCP
jgi:hypothetical protein